MSKISLQITIMLIQTHQLDDKQLLDLDALCSCCKKQDGNIVSIYRHLIEKYRSRPANILCYQEQMVGFLAAFFFSPTICEIALMVAPSFRKKGVASQLLQTIRPLIESEAIETIVFSAPHGLNDAWFTTMGLQYQHSEYQMQRTSTQPLTTKDPAQIIRLATIHDIDHLCAIDMACFPTQSPDMPHRFYELLHDPNQTLFVIEQNHIPIGKAHINWQEHGARLTDIAIIPTQQGRGFGGVLLTHCINVVLSMNKFIIRLDVETHNQNALGLYTRLGFEISNATDYWQMNEFGLTGFLQHI